MKPSTPTLLPAGRCVLPGAVLAVIAVLAGCGSPAPAAGDRALVDVDGTSLGTLAYPARGRWSTLIFVATECPVSNHYAPEIMRICNEYQPAGAQCALVYSGSHVGADAVRRHRAEFGLELPAMLDADRSLAARAGATVTPQAVVFNSDGKPAYSGRIDNLYVELGRRRHSATEHDLRDSLQDLTAGRPVRSPRTQAIGCYIE